MNYLEKINVKASQCYHYFVLRRVQPALLISFPNAGLNTTRSVLKQEKRRSDP